MAPIGENMDIVNDIRNERCLTISTSSNPSIKDVYDLIKKAIRKVEKQTGVNNGNLRALFVGENKIGSSRSNVWHIAFNRDITDEEMRIINAKIESKTGSTMRKPKGVGSLLFKWGIVNNGKTKNYILSNIKHTYFKERTIRG